MAGQSRKNDDADAQSAGHHDFHVFVFAAAQGQTENAQRNNRPKQPNMKSFSAENGCADGRKNADEKRHGDAMHDTNGRCGNGEFICQSDIFRIHAFNPIQERLSKSTMRGRLRAFDIAENYRLVNLTCGGFIFGAGRNCVAVLRGCFFAYV